MSLPSGSLPNAKMMKAADLRDFDHLGKSGRLDRSAERRIFCKRQMRPAAFVVGKIALHSSTQRSAVPHQDVVQAFASDGAHQPFRKGILPRGLRRGKHFLHSPLLESWRRSLFRRWHLDREAHSAAPAPKETLPSAAAWSIPAWGTPPLRSAPPCVEHVTARRRQTELGTSRLAR